MLSVNNSNIQGGAEVNKIGFILSCVLALLFTTAAGTGAAILQIDPPKIFLSIPAGETGSGKITLRNPSEQELKVKIYAQDWQYNDAHDGTKIFSAAGTLPLSCASWITVSQSDLSVPVDGQQDIYYTVKMPKDVSGGHYAVLFFESEMSKPTLAKTVSLGLTVRLGAIFYVESAGMTLRTAEVNKLSLQKPAINKPLEIGLEITNTGNTDFLAKGTFHFINKKGLVFARSSFNQVYAFPAETAKLSGTWKQKLPKGTYDVIFTIDIGKVMQEGMPEAEWNADFVITKETEVEIGSSGEVVKVGELR
jgi:hypothetical protein